MREQLGYEPPVIVYTDAFREYGLPIYNGDPAKGCRSDAIMVIRFCPWCGTRLPRSKRIATLSKRS